MNALVRVLDVAGGVMCLAAGIATFAIGVAVLAHDMSFGLYLGLYVDLGQFAVGYTLVTAGLTAAVAAAGMCVRSLSVRPRGAQ